MAWRRISEKQSHTELAESAEKEKKFGSNPLLDSTQGDIRKE